MLPDLETDRARLDVGFHLSGRTRRIARILKIGVIDVRHDRETPCVPRLHCRVGIGDPFAAASTDRGVDQDAHIERIHVADELIQFFRLYISLMIMDIDKRKLCPGQKMLAHAKRRFGLEFFDRNCLRSAPDDAGKKEAKQSAEIRMRERHGVMNKELEQDSLAAGCSGSSVAVGGNDSPVEFETGSVGVPLQHNAKPIERQPGIVERPTKRSTHPSVPTERHARS